MAITQAFVVDIQYCNTNITLGIYNNYKDCLKEIGKLVDSGVIPNTGATIDALGSVNNIGGNVSQLAMLDWLVITQLIGFGLFLWGLSYGLMTIVKVLRTA